MNLFKTVDPIPIPPAMPAGLVTEESILTLLLSIYGPTLSFAELLKVTKVGRSKAYQLMNPKHSGFDPSYPSGFSLFNSKNSPRAFWTRDAASWLYGRFANNFHFS